MRLATMALLIALPVAAFAQVPAKATVAVMKFSLGSHDSATIRRTDSMVGAIRAALVADTTVRAVPGDPADGKVRGPRPVPVHYMVSGATIGLRNSDSRPDGRMRVDWHVINIETSATSPRDTMTVLPGEDARAATIIAARVAAILREKSRRP